MPMTASLFYLFDWSPYEAAGGMHDLVAMSSSIHMLLAEARGEIWSHVADGRPLHLAEYRDDTRRIFPPVPKGQRRGATDEPVLFGPGWYYAGRGDDAMSIPFDAQQPLAHPVAWRRTTGEDGSP